MKVQNLIFQRKTLLVIIISAGLLITIALFASGEQAQAQEGPPIHPTFPLIDMNGQNVIDSGQPLSTMETCGNCHDTAFIANHSFHSDVGLNSLAEPGTVEGGQPWDISSGLFGKWNPLTYSYLSPEGDERVDLTTADWIKRFGSRHTGGGPAETSRNGNPLNELKPDPNSVQTSSIDPQTGELVAWDWQKSGTVEMNCFLCHWPEPNNEARVNTLQAGEFNWANSATLQGSGIISPTNEVWQWNEEAFDSDGNLLEQYVKVQDPSNENCGLCHGLVHVDPQTPTVLSGCSADQWSTITTGQIMSPQKINQSGLNIENKQELGRSWDVHTERVVGCTDCHYSLNNPIYYLETDGTRPDHLTFDPRRIDLGEYLYRPLHQFAKGDSAQGSLAPQFNNSLRRCDSCHETTETHEWLPYTDQHMGALSCESCHIPQMYAPARESMDWTVLNEDGTPASECRGVEGEGPTMASVLITGFEPVLLQREDADGTSRLAPHNLVSSWFWVYGDPQRPVPLRDLQNAWFDENQSYHQDIIDLFDANGDGQLDDQELIIDTEEKETLIAGRLSALGLQNPQIQAETRPYSISHNVTHGEWATKECSACHGEESRLANAMLLSDRTPGGVMPAIISDNTTNLNGELVIAENGQLLFTPQTDLANLYILGHNSERWIDLLGAFIFLATLMGVFLHAGMRFISSRRNPPHEPELQ